MAFHIQETLVAFAISDIAGNATLVCNYVTAMNWNHGWELSMNPKLWAWRNAIKPKQSLQLISTLWSDLSVGCLMTNSLDIHHWFKKSDRTLLMGCWQMVHMNTICRPMYSCKAPPVMVMNTLVDINIWHCNFRSSSDMWRCLLM
jgi:hypothetical protein